MATYKQTMNRVYDGILDGMRQIDGMVVNAVASVSDRFASVLPKELPAAKTLRNLPRPEDVVQEYFDFVERLVKTQRTYSMDLVKALEPVTRKIWKQPVRKAA